MPYIVVFFYVRWFEVRCDCPFYLHCGIVNNHCLSFRFIIYLLNATSPHGHFPTMHWLSKLHKQHLKFRFTSASSECYYTNMFILLTSCHSYFVIVFLSGSESCTCFFNLLFVYIYIVGGDPMLDRGFNPINLFHPVIVRNFVPVPSKDLDFQSPICRGILAFTDVR
jgi:hypothetical protein